MSLDALPNQLQATFWPGGRLPADGHVAWWGTTDPRSAAVALGLPPGKPTELPGVLWRENGLKPHRQGTFKVSKDPRFAAKLADI